MALFFEVSPIAPLPSKTAPTGVTGELWQGIPSQHYAGPRLFAAGPPLTSKLGHERPRTTKWAVCTTINAPSQQIVDTAKLQGWSLVIIGDKGGKPFTIPATNVVVLNPDEQMRWAAEFPSLLQLLPWKHFGRKNIGYLYAIAHGE
jgi:hypothetical protein